MRTMRLGTGVRGQEFKGPDVPAGQAGIKLWTPGITTP
jgi:hypothetical protein